ncbi:MAG: FKBP-type peptidyl-prolyl cis-trans isomerase [Cyclobacteriaceae bacterium]
MRKLIFLLIISQSIVLSSCLNVDNPNPGLSFEEQLKIDADSIDSYLELNEIEAQIHQTGVRYIITKAGDGESANTTDRVKVIYEGRFMDGSVFDSNSEGVSFPLNGLIAAWQITIPLLKEGGSMTIYAPSGYCYGPPGRSGIPPNSILFFDIELIEVE